MIDCVYIWNLLHLLPSKQMKLYKTAPPLQCDMWVCVNVFAIDLNGNIEDIAYDVITTLYVMVNTFF